MHLVMQAAPPSLLLLLHISCGGLIAHQQQALSDAIDLHNFTCRRQCGSLQALSPYSIEHHVA